MKYWTWYEIEEDWDYAYLLVSTDNGTHWTLLPGASGREADPNDQNLGHGFSGVSGNGKEAVWIEEAADLSAYAGKRILLRFAMQNDLMVNHHGFAVDDRSIPEIGWKDEVESGEAGWVSEGFIRSHNYVPQIWRVRAVVQRADETVSAQNLEIAKGTGQLALDLKGAKRLVVFVIGQTRYTTTPASYSLEVSP